EEFTLPLESGNEPCVVFSPDGQLLAACSGTSPVEVWDARTGKPVRSIPVAPGLIWKIAFGPDGRLAGGDREGTVHVWDPRTGAETQTLQTNSTIPYWHLAPTAAGLLFAGSVGVAPGKSSDELKVWDVGRGKLLLTLKNGATPVLALRPDGLGLACR